MSELEGLALRIHDYRQGVEHERERTVKLLKKLRCEKPHDCRKWHDHYAYSPDELIEILKGEVD
jgi:uncharacterized membrane-anchored protein YhcB (DUF1043 family)